MKSFHRFLIHLSKHLKSDKNGIFYFLFILYFLILILPFGYNDIVFGADQAELLDTAGQILQGKVIKTGYPSYRGYFHPGPFYRYFTALILGLSPGNLWFFHFLNSFVQSLTLLFLWLTGKHFRVSSAIRIALLALIASGSYFILLNKMLWPHGFLIFLSAVTWYYFVNYTNKKNIFLFHFFLNASIQTSLAFLPLGLPFFVFGVYKHIKENRRNLLPLLILYPAFWILPVYEALQNNGGNLARIFFAVTGNQNSEGPEIFERIRLIDALWFPYFQLPFLSVFLVTASNFISFTEKYRNNALIPSVISTIAYVLILLMMGTDNSPQNYYLAFSFTILFISLCIIFFYFSDVLKKHTWITATAALILLLTQRPWSSFAAYRLNPDWNDLPLGEIQEIVKITRKDSKPVSEIFVRTEGKYQNRVINSFLYIFKREGVVLRTKKDGLPSYRILLKPLPCPAQNLFESQNFCLVKDAPILK